MEVTNIKKEKKNTYLLTLDNKEELLVYDDVIVKYSLLPKKKISEAELNQIKKEKSELECYYKGLDYLNIKMRTKKEMREFLKKKEYSKDIIEKTVKKMEEEGYLNEQKYIQAYIGDNFRFSSDGPIKIKQKLLKQELSANLVEEELNKMPKEEWLAKLKKLIQKKANSKHNDGLKKWQQKCFIYFYNLGYPKSWIEELFQNINWTENESILSHEYDKLFLKWSRKLEGDELDFQIKIKLYEKGFEKEKIDNIMSIKKEQK